MYNLLKNIVIVYMVTTTLPIKSYWCDDRDSIIKQIKHNYEDTDGNTKTIAQTD